MHEQISVHYLRTDKTAYGPIDYFLVDGPFEHYSLHYIAQSHNKVVGQDAKGAWIIYERVPPPSLEEKEKEKELKRPDLTHWLQKVFKLTSSTS